MPDTFDNDSPGGRAICEVEDKYGIHGLKKLTSEGNLTIDFFEKIPMEMAKELDQEAANFGWPVELRLITVVYQTK